MKNLVFILFIITKVSCTVLRLIYQSGHQIIYAELLLAIRASYMSVHFTNILCVFSLGRKEFELTVYCKSLLVSNFLIFPSSKDTPHLLGDTRTLTVLNNNITNAITKKRFISVGYKIVYTADVYRAQICNQISCLWQLINIFSKTRRGINV